MYWERTAEMTDLCGKYHRTIQLSVVGTYLLGHGSTLERTSGGKIPSAADTLDLPTLPTYVQLQHQVALPRYLTGRDHFSKGSIFLRTYVSLPESIEKIKACHTKLGVLHPI